MIFKVKILKILCIFSIIIAVKASDWIFPSSDEEFSVSTGESTYLQISTELPNPSDQQFNANKEPFANRLFSALENETNSREKNMVFSPFSIEIAIAMLRMGAEGDTAREIDASLGLSQKNAEQLADYYHDLLASYENSSLLKIANKIYVAQGHKVQKEFNELLTKKFFSSIEAVDFSNNYAAAGTINTWVESITNNKIKNLINPGLLDSSTESVLVNAIHFKGKWKKEFPKTQTAERYFYLEDGNRVKVPTMSVKDNFLYGRLAKGTALAIPYDNSDLFMLVILPDINIRLADFENSLKNLSLPDLYRRMEYSNTEIEVHLPKFKAESDMELSGPLMKLGMKLMFSDDAEFGQILENSRNLEVSNVIHKALIEVNEVGTEAAAATAIKLGFRIDDSILFYANRPFVYFIANSKNILFSGSVKKF